MSGCHILRAIFRPRDGSREKVRKEVVSSRVNVERAVSRFEETITGLLDRNDELIGRAHVFDPNHTPRE
jgi:hypothetical protein